MAQLTNEYNNILIFVRKMEPKDERLTQADKGMIAELIIHGYKK